MNSARAVVAQALRAAARYHAEASVPPAAVFWPDPARMWEQVVPQLQEDVPILVLDEYDISKAQGPAIWIRAVLGAPESVELPSHLAERNDQNPWVIYLPGYARNSFSDAASLDSVVSPLAEIEARSNWWPSAHGQSAWTPHSFFRSKNGAGLDIAGDTKTKTSLMNVLDRFITEDIDELRRMGRLDASRLHSLVMTDKVRLLLEWLNDPEGTKQNLQDGRWEAFADVCRSIYGIDPTKDGQLSAAARLGAREGAWHEVWARFADNPHRYPNLREILDKARPTPTLFGVSDPHPDSWPSWNREQEEQLRNALTDLARVNDPKKIRAALKGLAADHVWREGSVWGELGEAPLARAMGFLAELAELSATAAPTGDLKTQVTWYASEGYKIDDLAVRAIAAGTTAADRDAVCKALKELYDPWVEQSARAFQEAATAGYEGQIGLEAAAGTCIVFVDALRFDLAQRLAKRLVTFDVSISSRLAAFPTLTPTGQPAVAPVEANFGAGQEFDAADAEGRSIKGQVFRAVLKRAGVQYLEWKAGQNGDTNGIGWTQTNTIDALGHDLGHALVDMLDRQLDLVAERIHSLLEAGWRRVVVVTDHGFLMPASAAVKVNLPLVVTKGDAARKPRVARLKADSTRPDFPTVPWTWDSSIEMVSAPGAAAFEAGTIYDHGGLSHQECVIPVVEVSATAGASEPPRIVGIRWTGQRCRIDFEPAEADISAEVRLTAGDPSSVVGGPKHPSEPGEAKVLVDEEDAVPGTMVSVVLLSPDGTIEAQRQTMVGGTR